VHFAWHIFRLVFPQAAIADANHAIAFLSPTRRSGILKAVVFR
jgi:hypothetical protein